MTDLHAAAAAAGLKRDWTDASGRPQQVADSVLEALLSRLDMTPAEQPFVSATVGAPILLPGASAGMADLVLEDGTTRPLPVSEAGVAAPLDVIGYHTLSIGRHRYTIAIAPPRCPQPSGRSWGVSVQIPSLRDQRASAFGDYGTLADAAAAFGRAGAAALAISPTHALFPADPHRFSPYAPSSRLFHNAMLADPSLVGAPFPDEQSGDLIDWPNALSARLTHLRRVYLAENLRLQAAVTAFAAEKGPDLAAHARFDALHCRLGGAGWPDWPTEFQDPASPAVQRFATEHADEISFFIFLQWLADQGLEHAQKAARKQMAIGLIADLAVGTDRAGSHGWSRRSDLLSGVSIGAPPDPLGPDGQNWGISALDPYALQRTDFSSFINTIRTALRHAGGLRIDHAIGLDHLWIVPDGGTAADGAYLTMPGDTLKNIVAIEAYRANTIVIAEDLGTVPPGLRNDLSRRGMLGMRVLPFERDTEGEFVPPAKWDADAVAMTGTHDTPTVAGWWKGRDLEWRTRISGVTDPASSTQRREERSSMSQAIGIYKDQLTPPLDEIMEAVAEAPATLAVFPMEDLLGLEEQPNLPGTTDQHPNWRRRMPAATSALLARPDVQRRTHMLSEKRPG
ncbi:4-alpha-glucanotransferase [Sphingomonas sp. IC4-52]|uniref:4-alpha-glucanotransferase n=1 Tax=Sphingomonas sp. IC4-52 TaxID=2887202 RepID=UPI001D111C48|nr:4-alpha-glucanotransferase [Sphingomonas sp. IC4-52]MCC2978553.1 4-alpha-glucanotransferase [Sphingomonas sp. IC4-52]